MNDESDKTLSDEKFINSHLSFIIRKVLRNLRYLFNRIIKF